MTTQEFSDQFDVLFNNVTSNQAPGINEYEKSVFLTKALNQLVTEYFNIRVDQAGGGFDGSLKRLYDFSSLLRTKRLFNVNSFKERVDDLEKLDRRSKIFLFPEDYFLAVNELLFDEKRLYVVRPLDYNEYQRLMLKPYNFPIKRGAWRIFTDKKNCNYCREYILESLYGGDVDTPIDYVIMTSWADLKRPIILTIKSIGGGSIEQPQHYTEIESITFPNNEHPKLHVDNKDIYCWEDWGGSYTWCKVTCNKSKYNSDEDELTNGTKYLIDITVNFGEIGPKDDEEIIECLKKVFRHLKKYYPSLNTDGNPYQVMTHMDGFQMCSAPSHCYRFLKFVTLTVEVEGAPVTQTTVVGHTFETKVIKLPLAEVIGKFAGDPEYQLRYVRTLKPIILDSLTNYGEDLTISDITLVTECELPEEAHLEILERAVTLAKIAWQGSTMTQTAAESNSRRNNNND